MEGVGLQRRRKPHGGLWRPPLAGLAVFALREATGVLASVYGWQYKLVAMVYLDHLLASDLGFYSRITILFK